MNSPSRIHGPENQKVRIQPYHLDILYKVGRGSYERYDPGIHGLWQIRKTDSGRFEIHRASEGDQSVVLQTELASTEPLELPVPGMFAAETHLRDYLATNLHVIEEGLQPFIDEYSNGHVEYRTDVGIIDLICLDKEDGLLVVELKVDRSSDAVAGQILRYVNWVRRHVANGRKVRGLIIAKSIPAKLFYSIDADPSVEAREYEMHVTLKPPENRLDQS